MSTLGCICKCKSRYEHWEKEFVTWNENKNRESSSGVGSSLENTENIRSELPNLFKKYKINTILDIPCGDFNWMRKLDLSSLKYTGMDISPSIIGTLDKEYGSESKFFEAKDIVKDSIETPYDLILSRDMLIHLSAENIMKVLGHFEESGSKYLLTSSYLDQTNNEYSVDNGFFRVNLLLEPFNYPKPIHVITENETGKYLCLWDMRSGEFMRKKQERKISWYNPIIYI